MTTLEAATRAVKELVDSLDIIDEETIDTINNLLIDIWHIDTSTTRAVIIQESISPITSYVQGYEF